MLTKEQADKIYNCLIENCGACPHNQQSFISLQTTKEIVEWRFGGKLGFGGKFWNNDNRWYVSCYQEDETKTRNKIIEKTNLELCFLKAKYDR